MLKRLIIFISIFSLALIPLLSSQKAEAASLTALSDTMTRLKAVTVADHEIDFTSPSGVAVGETITITFPATFASGLDGIAFGDLDLEDDNVDVALAATPSGATWGADVSARTITFTSGTGTMAAGSVITVEIGLIATNQVAGDTQIINSAAGSQSISIAGTFGDTGSFAIAIMSEDQITVTATVDPTISSTLSGAGSPTCALNTLSDTAVQGCLYTNTVSTNATSGYNSTIIEDGNLCSPSVAVCTNSITDVADGTITIAAEEYGVSTSDADAPGITATFDGICDDGANETGSAITGSAQIYADETTPQASDATNLCHSGSITATTQAGSYSHVVTHITTGNF